jgi:hypothetical protein
MERLEIGNDKIRNGRLVEGAYAEDLSITSVVIPECVTDIGEIAFYGCTNLREVIFPSGLRYIREEAFGESGIIEAMLPPGLERIEEKAFFSCGNLRRTEVPGPSTVIGSDAFGCCDLLHEGYIACGYPDNIRHHEELQYTLLWCSCPDRHTAVISKRAEAFIHEYEDLIMEWIIKHNNIPAMSGIAGRDLLCGNISSYIINSNLAGTNEITALLMSMRGHAEEGEFEL